MVYEGERFNAGENNLLAKFNITAIERAQVTLIPL